MHQYICAVLYAQLGSVHDHVVIIHITPGLSGMFIIIGGSFLVSFLHLFFCFIIGEVILSHNPADAVLFVRAYEDVQYVHPVLQDIGSASPEDDAGLLRKLADRFRLTLIHMVVKLFLDVGLVVYGDI